MLQCKKYTEARRLASFIVRFAAQTGRQTRKASSHAALGSLFLLQHCGAFPAVRY
jgi:hypothetical protein